MASRRSLWHQDAHARSRDVVVLISSERQAFEVDRLAAMESEVIRMFLPVTPDGLFLPNIRSNTLQIVIAYMTMHWGSTSSGRWSTEIAEVYDSILYQTSSIHTLRDLYWAADYLALDELIDFALWGEKRKLDNMSLEEMNELFGLTELDVSEEDKYRKIRNWYWPY